MSYKQYYKQQRKLALKNARTIKQKELVNSFYDNILKTLEDVKNGNIIR